MERVRDLIHKISAQEAAGEGPAALLATVRQLAAELEALVPRPVLPERKSVAVVLPAGFIPGEAHTVTAARAPQPANDSAASPSGDGVVMAFPIEQPAAPATPVAQDPVAAPEERAAPAPEPEVPAPGFQAQAPEPEVIPETPAYSLRPPVFDPVADVPTLAQQTPLPPEPAREVFEVHTPGESLNDRLRREERAVAHKLVETPIKDLRKGIGINDRYLFVSELFRGDESMYERSIKTINSFHILPEAEYWINRELKVKLGWDDTHPTVKHFDQLVRRRFS